MSTPIAPVFHLLACEFQIRHSSDRPDMCRMEWHWQVPLARYGEAWRKARNLLDRGLRPGAAATYRPMQRERVRVLLTRLLAAPNEWKDHVELCVSGFPCYDIFLHHNFQFPRRTYFGYDVRI